MHVHVDRRKKNRSIYMYCEKHIRVCFTRFQLHLTYNAHWTYPYVLPLFRWLSTALYGTCRLNSSPENCNPETSDRLIVAVDRIWRGKNIVFGTSESSRSKRDENSLITIHYWRFVIKLHEGNQIILLHAVVTRRDVWNCFCDKLFELNSVTPIGRFARKYSSLDTAFYTWILHISFFVEWRLTTRTHQIFLQSLIVENNTLKYILCAILLKNYIHYI